MNRRKAHFSFRQLNLDDGVMLVMGGSIPPISKLGVDACANEIRLGHPRPEPARLCHPIATLCQCLAAAWTIAEMDTTQANMSRRDTTAKSRRRNEKQGIAKEQQKNAPR